MDKDIENNRKGLCRHIGDKRKTTKNVAPLWKETRDLVIHDTEKAEILNDFFTPVFNYKSSNHMAQAVEGKDWKNEELPTV